MQIRNEGADSASDRNDVRDCTAIVYTSGIYSGFWITDISGQATRRLQQLFGDSRLTPFNPSTPFSYLSYPHIGTLSLSRLFNY